MTNRSFKFVNAMKPDGSNFDLSISEGVFVGRDDVHTESVIDLAGVKVFPGFIDIHNHGAVGIDVNEADADGLLKISGFLAGHGVTGWLPTLVPDRMEVYENVVTAIDAVMSRQDDLPVARILGIHYEGIFANPAMCGALRPEYFKTFTGREIDELPTLKRGVHLTTLAPEIDGGIELVGELTKRGWIASIGHTRADRATLDRAFAAGARQVTHLFNAMTGIHHRDLGVAGWALANDEVVCEIIADSIHVAPEMLTLAARVKREGKLILVSDCAAPTGLGDGEFDLWGEKIAVRHGRTQNERGSIAGSVITSLDAVKTYLALGFSPDIVAKMASGNVAAALGLSDCGALEPGKRADLVALEPDGSVKLVMIGGAIVG